MSGASPTLLASERVELRAGALSLDEVVNLVRRPGAGAIATFLGVVRDNSDGRVVTRLEYSAYEGMARREMAAIAAEIEAELTGVTVAVAHRTGSLEVGDAAVVCAASSPHRGEAFAACRALIDRIKSRVPIWKRESGPDGPAWVGWVDARCSADGLAPHGHEGYDSSTHRPPEG
jgi:molybdopterin synthase catalytic subunit